MLAGSARVGVLAGGWAGAVGEAVGVGATACAGPPGGSCCPKAPLRARPPATSPTSTTNPATANIQVGMGILDQRGNSAGGEVAAVGAESTWLKTVGVAAIASVEAVWMA